MTPLLSIDFDFWIPVRPDLEPRTAERGGDDDLHQWACRAVQAARNAIDLPTEIALAKSESPSPARLADWFSARQIELAPGGIAVMDQHVHAFDHCAEVSDGWLIHVDAHHDMGYGDGHDALHCGNWVERLIEYESLKRVTLIYPTWRRERKYAKRVETEAAIRQKSFGRPFELEVCYGLGSMPANLRFARTAIARSGCWSPPWLDACFNHMVRMFVGDPTRVYEPTPVRYCDWNECKQAATMVDRRLQSRHRLLAAATSVIDDPHRN